MALRLFLATMTRALPAAMVLAATTLHAQGATGKLEGRITDTSGAGLADAQVHLTGTAFGALTDPRGHYFINNVPAGAYGVRAAYIGFRPIEIQGLRLLADHTITQDFTLEPTPLQLREIAVVAAENVLVPRDEVTSKQRLSGEFARALPQDRLDDLLALQPGVVASPVGLSIRGGRPDEAAMYVDGVPVSPGYRGYGFSTEGTALSIGTNAVEEGAVITGAPSAEFGNAQSGIIAIATRSGGTRLGGSLSYETDEPFSVNHSLGFNRVEANLGGPLAGRLTFFLAGVLEGRKAEPMGFAADRAPVFVQAGLDTTVAVPSDATPTADTTYVDIPRLAVSRGRCEEFQGSGNEGIRTNYGLACRGIRTPGTARSILELQAKLNYTYGEGSRITLSHLTSRKQERGFDYGNLYNPPALFGDGGWNRVLTLTWSQSLSRSAERALALETSLSYQTDRGLTSPLSPESERRSRDPFGGFMLRPLKFLFDFDNFPLNQELVDNFRYRRPGTGRTPYDLGDPEQFRPKDFYRNNAYGLLGWTESGGPDGVLKLHREKRYLGRTIIDGQIDRFNRIKAGGEFIRYSIDRYQAFLTDIDIVGDVYLERPQRWNVFAENRLDLGDVVLVGGLRYDAYSSRAERPYVLDTVPESETFGEYGLGFDPQYEGEFQGRPLSISRRDRSHGYLSPRIQASFPVTERTNIRLSYAHQVEAPDFAAVLFGVNVAALGSDLDFGKTIAYEFGIRHAFSDDMVLDLAAYNRDHLANVAGRQIPVIDPVTRQQTGSTFRFTNADFGATRGVDLRLDRRIGTFFNGTLGYTYQRANSTASDPFTNLTSSLAALLSLAGNIGPPPQAILPTTFSRPHTLTGALAFTVPSGWRAGTVLGALASGFGMYSTFRFASGTPYTQCTGAAGNESALSGEGCPAGGTAVNGTRLPALKEFDLRLTKGFSLGGTGLTAYVDARNLFNFQNLNQVFAATGTTVSPRDQQKRWASDSSLYAAEAERSGVRQEDGTMDLRFGGAVASGCGAWVTADERPAAPNCVYLIRAEERYGDGDHLFILDEQRRASDAFYAVDRGLHFFSGTPRLVRLGVEVTF
ncbi:MAG: TonB-dependent receptor [Gemmatimonadales bacterium]|nr:TonB-dependent receptor [Gemmatimonadales bacterium]